MKIPMDPVTLELAGHVFENVTFDTGRYPNGWLAIMANQDDELVTKVTVNLPEHLPWPDCVWVKDYAENAGLAAQLEALGVIRPTAREMNNGLVTIRQYLLIGKWEGLDERYECDHCGSELIWDETEWIDTYHDPACPRSEHGHRVKGSATKNF